MRLGGNIGGTTTVTVMCPGGGNCVCGCAWLLLYIGYAPMVVDCGDKCGCGGWL